VASDFSNATDVADYLVARGVPFREAYQLVGRIVKTCLEEGLLLRDLPPARWRAFHPALGPDLRERLSPRAVVAARTSAGGTGFSAVRQALARLRQGQADP
jgi:argininosuccinate lyase